MHFDATFGTYFTEGEKYHSPGLRSAEGGALPWENKPTAVNPVRVAYAMANGHRLFKRTALLI
jgi:hypothetical protein